MISPFQDVTRPFERHRLAKEFAHALAEKPMLAMGLSLMSEKMFGEIAALAYHILVVATMKKEK